MADSAVSFLLQNLSRLLVDEVKLISGVEDQIRSLSNEFKFIDIFLKSSEGKRSNEFVKELVNQIRDAAHKVEDVVDTYVAEATVQRRRNKLSKLVHYPSHVMMLHDVDAEIGRIKRSIDEIYKSKERYNIGEGEFPSEDDAEESLRKRRRDVEEKEVVGLVQDTTFVINQLKETTSRRDAVSIIGMGGLGKTTLARKIYNNKEVHELFPYRAWGYVSNDYRVKELLLSLLKCLLSTSEYHDLFRKRDDEIIVSENEEEMKKEVKRSLQGKKYLVVLDDIWKTQVWDDIKEIFPDDNKSSRILITSRIKEVAFYTGTLPPYYLPFLKKEEGWVLFSKKVFHGEDCPSNLKDIGTSIVEGCGGLPLAIVVLAGLVAKKDKSQREWLQIKDHVRWHLTQEDILMDILNLSFNSLPRRLKSCFLYFGIYPEDYEILARQLIQLWIAEGFLQPPEIGTPTAPEQEDIGDKYLNELVDRSLVQVTSHRSDGGVKTCQIHDLLRDLCISESKANKFIGVRTELVRDECNPRRLSVHFNNRLLLSSPTQYNQSHTRSLFLFGAVFRWNKGYEKVVKGFKLARVLHFNGVFWAFAPRGLKTMIHLRYLKIEVRVKMSATSTILASICCLWNLESLDFKFLGKIKIPSGIWKLKRLKYLRLRPILSTDISVEANSETSHNLQTLGVVLLGPQITCMLNNDRFPKLTKLFLGYTTFEDTKDWKGVSYFSLLSLHHLSKLQTLKISSLSSLPSLFPPQPFYANLIESKFFPLTLTKITLKCFCTLDSKILGRLPNLRVLKLFGGSTREYSLDCADGEFPQLQVFEMEDMEVHMWRLEKGAMPCLSHLLISRSSLRKLPEQLWCLADLRQVHVIHGDESLHNSLQDVKLNNGCKLILSP